MDHLSKRARNKEFWVKKGKIPLWRIAEKLGIHEKTLIVWLRIEIEHNKMQKILVALDRVMEEEEVKISEVKESKEGENIEYIRA